MRIMTFTNAFLCGVMLSGAGVCHSSGNTTNDEQKRRTTITLELIEREQKNLGFSCSEATSFFHQYLLSVQSLAEKIKGEGKPTERDPVVVQGKRASDILWTCTRVHNAALSSDIPSPTPAVIASEEFKLDMEVIGLSLNSLASEPCEQKCTKIGTARLLKALDSAKTMLNKNR